MTTWQQPDNVNSTLPDAEVQQLSMPYQNILSCNAETEEEYHE